MRQRWRYFLDPILKSPIFLIPYCSRKQKIFQTAYGLDHDCACEIIDAYMFYALLHIQSNVNTKNVFIPNISSLQQEHRTRAGQST